MAEIKVRSEVTGVVCKVLVKPGDRVAEFDPVVLVESMKMEIPVGAPRAGTVASVDVAEGDPISDGETAATLTV